LIGSMQFSPSKEDVIMEIANDKFVLFTQPG